MRSFVIAIICLFASVILLSAQVVSNPQVIDNGGGKSYALNVKNMASIGQSVTGVATVGSARNLAGFVNAFVIEVTDVRDPDIPAQLPEQISMAGPYPNPFNSTCHFDITVPGPTDVLFEVYDVLGHKVYSRSKFYKYGLYHLTFNSGTLPSGVYLYKISAEHTNINGKFLLVR